MCITLLGEDEFLSHQLLSKTARNPRRNRKQGNREISLSKASRQREQTLNVKIFLNAPFPQDVPPRSRSSSSLNEVFVSHFPTQARWCSSLKVKLCVNFSSVRCPTKLNTADLSFNFLWPLGQQSNKKWKACFGETQRARLTFSHTSVPWINPLGIWDLPDCFYPRWDSTEQSHNNHTFRKWITAQVYHQPHILQLPEMKNVRSPAVPGCIVLLSIAMTNTCQGKKGCFFSYWPEIPDIFLF